MKNRLEECKEIVKEAINRIRETENDFEDIEITDELIYSLFGDNLDVENTIDDIVWMFTMEM
jgi:hypothetical protein